MNAEAQRAQDTVRDGAAMLLAYVRKDVNGIRAINAQSDIPSLLSGVLAAAGLLVNFYDENPEECVLTMVHALSDAPDSFWESAVENTEIIG